MPVTFIWVLFVAGCDNKPATCHGESTPDPLVFNKNWYINEAMGKENLGVHLGSQTTTFFHPNGFRQGKVCQSGEYIFFSPNENFRHQHDDEIIEVIAVDDKTLILSFENGQLVTFYSK